MAEPIQSAGASANASGGAAQGGVQGDGQQGGSQGFIPIPEEKLAGLTALGVNPRDVNNLVNLALTGYKMKHRGYVDLDERAEKRGHSGHSLVAAFGDRDQWDFSAGGAGGQGNEDPSSLDGQAEAELQRQIEEAQRRAAGQGQGQGQRDTYTYADVLAAINKANEPTMKEVRELKAALKAEKDQAKKEAESSAERREIEASFKARDSAIDEALAKLGIEDNPQEVAWVGGTKRKIDMQRKLIRSAIRETAEELQAESMPVGMTEAQQQRILDRGVPAEYIRQAAAIVGATLPAGTAKAVKKEIDRLGNMPGGTIPAGAGGMPSKNAQDMTQEELAEQSYRELVASGQMPGGGAIHAR
jgi:hypothetical protein